MTNSKEKLTEITITVNEKHLNQSESKDETIQKVDAEKYLNQSESKDETIQKADTERHLNQSESKDDTIEKEEENPTRKKNRLSIQANVTLGEQIIPTIELKNSTQAQEENINDQEEFDNDYEWEDDFFF